MRPNTAPTAYTPHTGTHGDHRDVERMPLGRRGVLRIGDGVPPIEVVVLDLTRDGCGIRCDTPVRPGMQVEIGIANVGRVPGTVLWHGPDTFGCMFDRSLPAGSVTAASGPRNVLPFPLDPATAARPDPANKLPPRARLLLTAGAMVLCWSAIGALAFAIG